jgi:hypothetical protein
MTFSTEARVATASAKKYAAQVGKHWQHNMEVAFDGDVVTIRFPRDARGADWPADALVTLTPEADALVCRIDASAPGQRDGLKGAVERHVDRFAFREGELAYDWKDA